MEDFFSKPLVWVGIILIGLNFFYVKEVSSGLDEEEQKRKKKYFKENQISLENISPRPFEPRKKPIIEQILLYGSRLSILSFVIYFFQQCS